MGVNNPYSLLFSSNSYVTFPNKITSNGAKSIRLKIKKDTLPTGLEVILSNKSGSSEKGVTVRLMTDGRVNFYVANGSGSSVILFNISSTKTVCDGQWHDIALTWDGTTSANGVKIYIDDMTIPDTTGTSTGTDSVPTRNMEFGKVAGGTSYYYNGYLDDVEFWNRELSSAELIESRYRLELKNTNGLTNHYRFNDNGVISDSVGSISGTPYNISWSNISPDLFLNKVLILNGSELLNVKNGERNKSLIPAHTSATSPIGTASASSIKGVGNEAWRAFDGDKTDSSFWATNVGVSQGWLQYKFEESKAVELYKIYPRSDTTQAPKSWTFEGSNDGGVTWDILDTKSGVTTWAYGTPREYPLANNKKYLYYRLNITSENGGGLIAIAHLELISSEKGTVKCISSKTEENFFNYGMDKETEIDLFSPFGTKGYILQEEQEDVNGLRVKQLTDKPLSIRLN